jgi:hypothetical protein
MANTRRTTRVRKNPDMRETAPPPEATNHDHAAPVGAHGAVPGAGIVSSDADAGPIENQPERRDYPGHGTGRARKSAPGARRAGTTHSRPASVPTSGGPSSAGVAGSPATEATTIGSDAPLSVPTDEVGPVPRGTGLREIADPNFPISQRREATREKKERAKRRK